jgi:hypothetical protein
MSLRISSAILLATGLFGPGAFAQTPPASPPSAPPVVEPLPAPRPIVTPYIIMPAPSKFGTREVWQDFAPDFMGRMRPRVVLAPYESSYYIRNGAPYRFFRENNSNMIPATTR